MMPKGSTYVYVYVYVYVNILCIKPEAFHYFISLETYSRSVNTRVRSSGVGT